jgi:type IV pilus assembly protein PilW
MTIMTIKPLFTHPAQVAPRSRGFSLIELLVAMAIGLVVTLAISSVMIRTEGSKRSTTSVNDINQAGSYSAFVLDRHIRSAGSGFSQRYRETFGCVLNAKKGADVVLPLPTLSASSPFKNFAGRPRLYPVIIGENQANPTTGGDVLMVMSGSGGMAELPLKVQPNSVTNNAMRLYNAMGLARNDLILLTDTDLPGCLLTEVGERTRTDAGQNLPLLTLSEGGKYHTDTGTNVNLDQFGGNTQVLHLGNTEGSMPQFKMYAVGGNNTLFSYDMLQKDVEDAVTEGVLQMHALYGVDTNSPPDGKVDAWVAASGAFAASTLTDGSTASQANLRQIIAIRVGMILRTSLSERAPPNSASNTTPAEGYRHPGTDITLFGDLAAGLQPTPFKPTSDIEKSYRYRTIDTTIPLRNVVLAQ